MRESPDAFFGSAKRVRLEEAERSLLRASLLSRAREQPVRMPASERLEHEMEPTSEHFFARARAVALPPPEKSALFAGIRSFMARHPLPEGPTGFLWGTLLRPFSLRTLPVTAVLVIFLTTSGGLAAYAAESALPGDFLYPFKVEVTEPFREWMSLSPEAKARWSMRRMERRIEEAERLLLRAGLDPEKRRELSERLARHAARLQERILLLSSTEQSAAAADIVARMESALEAHEAVLERLAEGTAGDAENVAALITDLRAVKRDATHSRKQMENLFSRGLRQEHRKAASEEMIIHATRAMANVRAELPAEELKGRTLSKVTRRLAKADQLLAQARERWSEEKYEEAFALARQANRTAQTFAVLLHARQDLDIDVSLSGGKTMPDVDDGETDVEEEAMPVIFEEEEASPIPSGPSGSPARPAPRDDGRSVQDVRSAAQGDITTLRSIVSTEPRPILVNQLELAEQAFAEGEAQMTAGEEQQARPLFQRSGRIAQDALMLWGVMREQKGEGRKKGDMPTEDTMKKRHDDVSDRVRAGERE